MFTSHRAVRDLVEPACDAIAANDLQDRALFDPSHECDSATEHAQALARLLTTDEQRTHLRGLVACLAKVAAANRDERAFEHAVAGAADELARDLHAAERQINMDPAAIARRLERPLRILGQPHKARAKQLVGAKTIVDDAIERIPLERLLSIEVREALGVSLFTTLHALAHARKWTAV